MTTRVTRTSGISKQLPKVLAYPKFYQLERTGPVIKDHLCYVIRHYGREGISVVIARDPKQDNAAVLCGDWHGNNLDLVDTKPTKLTEAALQFVKEDLPLFLRVMHFIKVPQAQFFLATTPEGLTLVDMQVSLNKLAGPGMLRDIFGKVYRTQEVLKVEPIDSRALEYLEIGTGNYTGDLIIKPSKFSMFSPTTDELVPLYTELRR